MWPAPTAEDWKKPCLITWQRTWEDAQELSRETGKPILVCVNMDGEIASEHYAGIRYRQPEIVKLYEPYVTVIASVYRHTPRDHDDEGQRILCPRFGGVTCGEHIAIEPGLYGKFMDTKRIAPRHIGIELDGEEMYDVYYAFDTDSVFAAIRDGMAEREDTSKPPLRGDRSLVERVASRDSRDQTAVEKAYQEGDTELRRALLEAAIAEGDKASVDLLRLAIFGFDVELSKLARQALAASGSAGATDLITDALRVPMGPGERNGLIGALERIGNTSPKARTLAAVHRGLATGSETVDVQTWVKAFGEGQVETSAIDRYMVDSKLASQNEVLHAADAGQLLDLAEAFLARAFETQGLAINASAEQEQSRLLFMDAQRTARESEKLGESGWRVHAVLALSSYYLKNNEEAHERAETAVKALPTGAPDWNAMAVLELFAKLRCQVIAKAVEEKKAWPPEWLTDVNAACSVLARHPFGTDAQIAWHYDILKWLKAHGQADRVLHEGLVRFSDSWQLHTRLRGSILREKGVEGLEPVYEGLLQEDDAGPNIEWYAGYASFITAEFRRRRGRDTEAMEAYKRAMDHYERAIEANPDSQDTSDQYIAMARGGRARIALENKDYEQAVAELLESFQRKPAAAANLDGLNISAVDTAKMLLARLRENQRTELATQVQKALDALDPELLLLPAYEGRGPLPGNRRGATGQSSNP